MLLYSKTLCFFLINYRQMLSQMKQRRILIVEDDLIISLVLEKMVSRMGHIVLDNVTTGELAVEKALTLQPDIILMDIRLKGEMDGIEALTEIQNKIDACAIYITGNTDPACKERMQTTDYLDLLVKPIMQHQLSDSLERAS